MNVMNVDRLAEFWANLILDDNGWLDRCMCIHVHMHTHTYIYIFCITIRS